MQEHCSLSKKLRDLSSDSSQYSFNTDWNVLASLFSRQENWNKNVVSHRQPITEPGLDLRSAHFHFCAEIDIGAKIKKLHSEREGLPLFGQRLTDFGNGTKCHTFLWQLWVFPVNRCVFPRTFPWAYFWLPLTKC